MKYRNVGKSGLKVSEIAVGSWMTDLAGSEKVDVAEQTIRLAYENGVNFFDCADAYSGYRFDPTTPMEETLRALSDLVTQGKILYYGVSEEWGTARLEKAQRIKQYGIGITPFSPLAQGLLTGKYKKGQPYPKGSRATHQADKQINQLLTDENLDKVEKMSRIAEGLGVTMSVLALSWILKHDMICNVVTGASKPSQLESNLRASEFEVPEDAMREIEEILGFHRFERHVG